MKKLFKKFNVLWYTHPRMAIALMLVAVNLLVILLFTCILTFVSGQNFFDSLAYLFTFTLSSHNAKPRHSGNFPQYTQQYFFTLPIFATNSPSVIAAG